MRMGSAAWAGLLWLLQESYYYNNYWLLLFFSSLLPADHFHGFSKWGLKSQNWTHYSSYKNSYTFRRAADKGEGMYFEDLLVSLYSKCCLCLGLGVTFFSTDVCRSGIHLHGSIPPLHNLRWHGNLLSCSACNSWVPRLNCTLLLLFYSAFCHVYFCALFLETSLKKIILTILSFSVVKLLPSPWVSPFAVFGWSSCTLLDVYTTPYNTTIAVMRWKEGSDAESNSWESHWIPKMNEVSNKNVGHRILILNSNFNSLYSSLCIVRLKVVTNRCVCVNVLRNKIVYLIFKINVIAG